MDTRAKDEVYALHDAAFERFEGATDPGIPQTLEGLVVDVCGVLYDNSPWRRWLLRLLNRIGLHARYGIFYRVWDRDYQDDVITGIRPYWDAMSDYLRSTGISVAQITEITAAGRAKREELEGHVRLFPGVRRTIEQLSARGVRLTVACSSPWPVAVIEEKLESLMIRHHFVRVATTNVESRVGTFDRCIHDAVEGLELEVEQIGFVGSDPQGLCWARRENAPTIAVNSSRDAVADIHIRRFDELLGVVKLRQVQRVAG